MHIILLALGKFEVFPLGHVYMLIADEEMTMTYICGKV